MSMLRASSELNGWIQVNRNAIAHFVEDAPQREIDMDWVQVTALQTGDGLGSYMPLWGVYNPKTGKREAKALKGLKASAGKFFNPAAYPDEESVENAYKKTIMSNVKDLGGPSSDFLNWVYNSRFVENDVTAKHTYFSTTNHSISNNTTRFRKRCFSKALLSTKLALKLSYLEENGCHFYYP